MNEFFTQYARFIVFFHIFFAVVWVGGMIALRYAVHHATGIIEDKGVRLRLVLGYLSRFFKMVFVALAVIGVTGFVMLKAADMKALSGMQAGLMHLKTQIWTLMTMVFGYIYFKYSKARGAYDEGNIDECGKLLAPIAKYLIPTNIALGVLAIFFGVIARGY
jgi:uncharacterized membrane protein